MDEERMSKLKVYCENLPDDERTALIEMLMRMAPTDPKDNVKGIPAEQVFEKLRSRIEAGIDYAKLEKVDADQEPTFLEKAHAELRAEFEGRQRAPLEGAPHRRTLEFTFKKEGPIVVQLNFSKKDLSRVVSYCEQVYTEPDPDVLSLRFPVELPKR